MSMQADKDGFLVGAPIGGGDSDRLLGAIKGDTGKILAAMRQSARSGEAPRPAATPAPRGSNAGRVAVAAAASAARAAAHALPAAGARAATPAVRSRDAAGRFVSGRADSAGPSGAVTAQSLTQVAEASSAIARTAEAQRRQDKADQVDRKRGADGRFGAGDGRGRGGIGERLSSIGAGAGAAIGSAEGIDPLLGAIGEVRGLAETAKNVVTPVGRALGGLFGRGGGGDQAAPEVGWLKRMWRELRGMRKDRARGGNGSMGGGGGGEGGGGFLGMLAGLGGAIGGGVMGLAGKMLPMVLGVLGTVFSRVLLPVAALIGSWKLGQWIGEKVYEWMDKSGLLEKVFNGIDAVRESVGKLWDGAKDTWQSVKEGAGKALDSAKSAAQDIGRGAGAVVESIGGAGKKALGWVSGLFESGKAGAGAVSTGKGDFGGASYGKHQFSSSRGTLQQFLGSSGYAAQFEGLKPGSPEFNAKWKQIAASDSGFAGAQQSFMERTHFDPQMAKLKGAGIDLSGRGAAVKEAVFSTATQFGPNSSVIRKALAGRDASAMSDADIISAVQDYKIANNGSLFRSSSKNVQDGVLKRAYSEKATLLAANADGAPGLPASMGAAASPLPASLPRMAAGLAPVVLPPAPSAEAGAGTRLNSPGRPAQAPAPTGGIGQDVRDRTIAHIVTGGIGGVMPSR